jgi:uncharacterized protein (DUF58 family)
MAEADRVASTVAQGVHGRRRIGPGDAFWQFRRYQPGDSAAAIDWRQSAKRQNTFVRENEWDTAESIWIWCDRSASMNWQSAADGDSKLDRAMVLTLALATLLVRGGEQVALLGDGHKAATGRAVLDRMTAALASTGAPGHDDASDPPRALLPRHARLVLIGDFLSPYATTETWITRFADAGVAGHLLQIVDPAEEDLPYSGRAQFEGLEGEAPYIIGRVEDVAEQWRDRLAQTRAALGDLARRVGWSWRVHRTDRPATTALLGLYMALSGE